MGQCFLDQFWELAFQSFQNGMNRLSILDQLADVLIQKEENFLKFDPNVF
jgi:hypothetical protein